MKKSNQPTHKIINSLQFWTSKNVGMEFLLFLMEFGDYDLKFSTLLRNLFLGFYCDFDSGHIKY